MTGPKTNGDIHTLAGAYALDALTEIERASFARHVAGCEACAVEVAELRETSSRLGGALSEPPPASLRVAVMAEVVDARVFNMPSGSYRSAKKPRLEATITDHKGNLTCTFFGQPRRRSSGRATCAGSRAATG